MAKLTNPVFPIFSALLFHICIETFIVCTNTPACYAYISNLYTRIFNPDSIDIFIATFESFRQRNRCRIIIIYIFIVLYSKGDVQRVAVKLLWEEYKLADSFSM